MPLELKVQIKESSSSEKSIVEASWRTSCQRFMTHESIIYSSSKIALEMRYISSVPSRILSTSLNFPAPLVSAGSHYCTQRKKVPSIHFRFYIYTDRHRHIHGTVRRLSVIRNTAVCAASLISVGDPSSFMSSVGAAAACWEADAWSRGELR